MSEERLSNSEANLSGKRIAPGQPTDWTRFAPFNWKGEKCPVGGWLRTGQNGHTTWQLTSRDLRQLVLWAKSLGPKARLPQSPSTAGHNAQPYHIVEQPSLRLLMSGIDEPQPGTHTVTRSTPCGPQSGWIPFYSMFCEDVQYFVSGWQRPEADGTMTFQLNTQQLNQAMEQAWFDGAAKAQSQVAAAEHSEEGKKASGGWEDDTKIGPHAPPPDVASGNGGRDTSLEYSLTSWLPPFQTSSGHQ